jgi:4-amino-4-deoxy-L-arabinose transferase-like glycosyltransferase
VLLAESTLLLEPFLTLCALTAILLVAPPTPRPVSRSAAIAAGAVLAVGLAIKLWMVIPIGLIGARLLIRRDLRGFAWLAIAGTLVSIVLWTPSFLVDPAAAIRDVFVVQAARPADGVAGVTDRLLAIFGFGPFGAQLFVGPVSGWIGIVVAGLTLVWAVLRGGGEGRWWSALLVVTTAFFLVSPSYYLHYAAFAMPALAILIGGCLSAGIAWVRAQGRRPLTIGVTALLAIALLATMARAVRQQLKVVGPGDDYGREIAARVPETACVATDVPTWLLLADRRPEPTKGDEPMADLFGAQHVAALAADPDRFATSTELLRSPASEEVLDAYLRSCPFVLVAESQSTWPPGAIDLLEREYEPVADWTADGGPRLWARR